MRDDITKKYRNDEITVVWQPKLCCHSTLCWKGLESVFNPKVRPWVKMDGATTEQIIAQVNQCPSGALSYFRNGASNEPSESDHSPVIEVSQNGPLEITGEIIIRHSNGREETRLRKTSLCRCGQSGNKPFCDGSHTRTGFKG